MADAADLLVVGGGPAGLATAIEARLAGFDTLLIDRRKPPIDVACGEGLMPVGVERLQALGVEIPENERAPFYGIRYVRGDSTADARFAAGAGQGIRRSSLHRALVRRAEELGVRVRWGVAARGLRPDGIDSDDGALTAQWTVAADGRSSAVRQWAALDGRPAKRRRFGVRRHFRTADVPRMVEVHWSERAEAYITPVGPDVIGVAMLSAVTPVRFDTMILEFPDLRERLAGAEVVSRDRGAGPFGQRPRAVVRGTIALVGDASGCLDPITGEGISVALAEAHALVKSLERGRIEDYAAAHRRIMRVPRVLTALLLAAATRPRLRGRIVPALQAQPRVFSRLVRLAAR